MSYVEELVMTYVDYLKEYCNGEWDHETKGDWFCKYCEDQEEVYDCLDLFDTLYNKENDEYGRIL